MLWILWSIILSSCQVTLLSNLSIWNPVFLFKNICPFSTFIFSLYKLLNSIHTSGTGRTSVRALRPRAAVQPVRSRPAATLQGSHHALASALLSPLHLHAGSVRCCKHALPRFSLHTTEHPGKAYLFARCPQPSCLFSSANSSGLVHGGV